MAYIDSAGVDACYGQLDLVGYAPWPNEVPELLAGEPFPIVTPQHQRQAQHKFTVFD